MEIGWYGSVKYEKGYAVPCPTCGTKQLVFEHPLYVECSSCGLELVILDMCVYAMEPEEEAEP